MSAAILFAPASTHAIPFFKGYGRDGVQPGEHGVGAFYQHQKSAQGTNAVDPATGQVKPPDPFDSDPHPVPLMAGYDQTWDHDSDPTTPQIARNWWEGTPGGGNFDGGWCGTTAWVNSFYYFSQHGFPQLFDHSNLGPQHQGKSWLERFTYANEDLAIRAGLGCAAFPRGAGLEPLDLVPKYIADYGYKGKFTYKEYFVDPGTNEVKRRTAAKVDVPVGSTVFNLYRKELRRSEDVLLVMQGTSTDWWWSGSFHVVTGAGFEAKNSTIWFADPDVGRLGKAGWGHSFLDTDPLPETLAHYVKASFAADGRTFNAGPYSGAFITDIYVLSPIPEPSTLLLLGTGCILLLRLRRNGRANDRGATSGAGSSAFAPHVATKCRALCTVQGIL